MDRAKVTVFGFAVIFVLASACVAPSSASHGTSVAGPEEGRDKKVDKMMKDMYTAIMLAKSMIGMVLMFVSPIIQIKGFGLSVINTLINIGRLILQMQATKQMKVMKSPAVHFVHPVMHEEQWSAPSGQYAYYAPPPPRRDWGATARGSPQPGIQEHLPPARPSYTSTGLEDTQTVYPYYSPNTTLYR